MLLCSRLTHSGDSNESVHFHVWIDHREKKTDIQYKSMIQTILRERERDRDKYELTIISGIQIMPLIIQL